MKGKNSFRRFPTVLKPPKTYIELVHSIEWSYNGMDKERKNKSKKTRVGISFENSVLELLDPFAKIHFKGGRSAEDRFFYTD